MNINYTPLIFDSKDDSKYECNNVLLIDSMVEDYQTIINSVNSNTMAIVYSCSSTKEDLLYVLSKFIYITRIGIAFTFNSNNRPVIFLDNQPFFTNDINNENVSFIIDIINNRNVKNIDFLACNTLNYDNWKYYYNILSTNTSVIIGASDNRTGNIKYGGDWILESTSQDVEKIYFTDNIDYYKYLFDNETWLFNTSASNISSLITMYDSINNTNIMIISSSGGMWSSGCNFNPPTSGTNNYNNTCEFTNSSVPRIYDMIVYTSSYNNISTINKLVIASLNTNYIGYYYNYILNTNTNINTHSAQGSYSLNQTWLNTGATLSSTTKLALYNNRLFYSLNTGTIGSALITDGTTPTISTANNSYITTTILSSSTTLYPLGLTTDTNGYLYAILGNITTSPTTGVIKVINVTSTPTLYYTISLTSLNITNWGNPYRLLWYSNNLYIGTYINTYTSSLTGNILYCITTSGQESTVTSTLTQHKSTKSIGAISINGNYLYVGSLNGTGGTTISQYDIVIPPISISIGNNPTGFRYNNIDICNNFSSIVMVTNPQYNGSSFLTNYSTYYNGQYYDLAKLYYINTTLISTPLKLTNMYTIYNSQYYDLNSFLMKITPTFTNTTGTYSQVTTNITSPHLLYYFYSSKLSGGSPVTMTLTINVSITINIILCGSGGNGTNGTSSSGGAGGGAGALIYTEVNIVPGTIYTFTVGSTGTTFSGGGYNITAENGSLSTGGSVSISTGGNNTLSTSGTNGSAATPSTFTGQGISKQLYLWQNGRSTPYIKDDMYNNIFTNSKANVTNVQGGFNVGGTGGTNTVGGQAGFNDGNSTGYLYQYTGTNIGGSSTLFGNGGGGGGKNGTGGSGGGGIVYIYI